MDSETMEPIDVEVKKLFETNSMVEEFMLQANISVAEKILKDFPDCAMLRRHPQPPPSNFDPLIKAGKHLVCLSRLEISIVLRNCLNNRHFFSIKKSCRGWILYGNSKSV